MMERKKKNPSSKSKDDECMKKEMDKIVVKSDTNHISEDLIMEILLRLPPTSVLRCKYVCKTWYSLISNPDFLRTHSSSLQFYKQSDDEELMVSSYLSRGMPLKYQNKEHPLLKLFSQSTPPPSSEFYSILLDCCAINSCNGLLLFWSSTEKDTYYVCNPITRQYFKIPNIRVGEKLENCPFTYHYPPYVLFDPSTSLSYKLIRCLMGETENGGILCEFYVYSWETGSWRFLKSFPFNLYEDPTVLLNGIFYWKAHNGDHMLCFDLKKESVWFLPLPPKPVGYSERRCFYFGECDGRLRLIEEYLDSYPRSGRQFIFPCTFDIMETKPQQPYDGNLTWSVKYHVNIETGYDHLIINHLFTVSIIQLYKLKNKGEEEALLLNIHGKIVPFNLKNYTFGKPLKGQTSIFTPSTDLSNVFPHIMTLFPLL